MEARTRFVREGNKWRDRETGQFVAAAVAQKAIDDEDEAKAVKAEHDRETKSVDESPTSPVSMAPPDVSKLRLSAYMPAEPDMWFGIVEAK